MSSVSSQALISKENVRGLRCDDCEQGYADCRCIAVWADETKKKERDAEIRRVTGAVMREIQIKQPPREAYKTTILHLPSDLIAVLKTTAKNRSWTLGGFVSRLLRTHSAPADKRLLFFGERTRVKVRIPEIVHRRLKLRAQLTNTSVSSLAQEHITKELASLQELC